MKPDVTHLAGNLWIGSHPYTTGHRCGMHTMEGNPEELVDSGFEVVVLCAEEWQPKIPGVKTIHAPFDDDPKGLDARQARIASGGVRKTAESLAAGKKTLVTCWAGRNRSGLVSALALAGVTGSHPRAAGDLIRSKREGALTNMAFRSMLSKAKLESPCELCEAKLLTRRYHEDAICWIADCKQCRVPMAVYRAHGVTPPPQHLEHMIGMLKLCANPRRGGYILEDRMETIPDHYHVHLRPE